MTLDDVYDRRIMPIQILILTADAGFGHRKAAQAIEAALLRLYGDACHVEIANPLQDPSIPDLVRQLETGYDEAVIDDPTLYQLTYSATDAPVVARLIQDITTTVLNKSMGRIIEANTPDAIVTTHPAFTQAAIRAVRGSKQATPVSVVVTDLVDVHSLWFHREASLTFVPTGNVYRQALDAGLPKANVHLTGLPVHPDFADEKRDQAALRMVLGWEPHVITALIIGSARTKETAGIARLLDRSGLELQIVAVSGNNPETEDQLKLTNWKSPVHVYGMVNNMPEFMHAADFVVCKAGGLVISEALACGQAVILYEALPGQEVGNVRYIVENRAGVWSPGPIGVLATAYQWLSDKQRDLKKHRRAAKHIGKARAAYDIAERLYGRPNAN
jgi:UDP-N-acetylglucosamine:LPS N-acetylglucosamine transferase